MISFLKNIFQSSNQKNSSKVKTDELTKIYFDRYKKSCLEVKMSKEYTCQDIHIQYHSEILAELMKNNTPNNSSNSFSKIINANEYGFMILDDQNPYSEIKLKMKDSPSKFLKKVSTNLFYLNISSSKKEDSGLEGYRMADGQEGFSINPVNQTSINSSQLSVGECIREGELMKFSFKHKKFDKRIVVLDKEKLIITKPKNKESTILLLSDISSINRELSDKSARDKYTFEITTYEGDHYIFKSKHNADLESWIESIYNFLSLIRDNKFIIKYGEQINKLVKDSYEKGMKIIYNCLSLKGLVSIKETRELLFKMYDDKQVCILLEAVINYKHNLRYYKYQDALKNFEEIFEIMQIDNFDLNTYYLASNVVNPVSHGWSVDEDIVLNPSHRKVSTESFNSEMLEEMKNLGSRNNSKILTQQNYFSTTNRKGSIPENIKERKVLLENSNKTSGSKERDSILRKTSNSEQFKQFDVDEEKTEGGITLENKRIREEVTSELNSKNKSSQSLIKLDNTSLDKNELKLNSNTSNPSNLDRHKILLVKHLLSFENLKYLKNLKLEIKDIIEKNKSEGQVNDSKLYESLKPNIFNEIFDNILSKYLQNFYKTINTNPSFTSRIENLLLNHYKLKNKINYSSLIDLENNFHSPLNQHKISNSLPEIKIYANEEKIISTNNPNTNSDSKK